MRAGWRWVKTGKMGTSMSGNNSLKTSVFICIYVKISLIFLFFPLGRNINILSIQLITQYQRSML